MSELEDLIANLRGSEGTVTEVAGQLADILELMLPYLRNQNETLREVAELLEERGFLEGEGYIPA